VWRECLAGLCQNIEDDLADGVLDGNYLGHRTRGCQVERLDGGGRCPDYGESPQWLFSIVRICVAVGQSRGGEGGFWEASFLAADSDIYPGPCSKLTQLQGCLYQRLGESFWNLGDSQRARLS